MAHVLHYDIKYINLRKRYSDETDSNNNQNGRRFEGGIR